MIVTRRDSLQFLSRCVASAAVVAAAGHAAGHAAAQERVVADWRTGLALYGYDPVAYFVDAAPTAGVPAFEVRLDGAIWRFCNAGNKAAFLAHPQVYMPRFGGYDAVALARGVATPGHPTIWQMFGSRLYLFHDAAAHTAFSGDAARAVAAAEAKWPQVAETLLP